MSDAEQEAGIVARLRRRGEQALAHARELLRSSEWRVDAEEARTGDRVQSAHVAGVGRVFLLTAMYDCTADELWKILCEDIDKLPKGETVISLYSVQPDEATARTRLHFLSCCRLGGWLPQSAIERFFVPSYLDFAAHLRKHVRK
ncbi:Protein of unknown function [Gryllus bimaculatus]|nr:Protein of unknown function [Gryllus bimaculatus]